MTEATYRVVFELAHGNNHHGTDRVDTELGIIRGVKLVGVQSKNLGRTLGLDVRQFGDAVNRPYRYAMEALKAAIPMYEAASIYSNHQPWVMENGVRKINLSAERSNDDLVGWPQKVIAIETGNPEIDGLYGDWHYVKSHPLAGQFVEIAQRKPEKLAMSHEAIFADVRVKNGIIEIGRIAAVEAIALVNQKPGTTNSLFENVAPKEPPVPKLLKQVIESLAADHAGRAAVLELMGDGFTDMPMEAEVADGGDADAQINDAFRSMVIAAYDDETLDSAATVARIKEILKAKDKLSGKDTPDTSGGDGAATETDTSGEGEKGGKAAAEIALGTTTVTTPAKPVLDAAIVLECATMLSNVQLPYSGAVLEGMALIPTKEGRQNFVTELAKNRTNATAPLPKSGPTTTKQKTTPAPAAETFKEVGSLVGAFRRN